MSHHITKQTGRRGKDVGVRRHRLAATVRGGERCHPVMSVAQVAERFLQAGAVVMCDVPFRDGTGRKIRPAVVVGRDGRTVKVMPITTSKNTHFPVDVPLFELRAAGLTRPSTVQTGRIVQIDRYAVTEVLGVLGPRDCACVLGSDAA